MKETLRQKVNDLRNNIIAMYHQASFSANELGEKGDYIEAAKLKIEAGVLQDILIELTKALKQD